MIRVCTFRDDPKLTPAEEAVHARGRGGSGIVAPVRAPDGGWLAHRDIVIGAGITDHARCAALVLPLDAPNARVR